jgi:hypothetical protein
MMLPPPILASGFLLASLTLIATMFLAPIVAFIGAVKPWNFYPNLRIGRLVIAGYTQQDEAGRDQQLPHIFLHCIGV